MSKTLGLVLGSGGARGVAHAGFLYALEEQGIKPDYVTGCSMGSVVGGCYASGMTAVEIKDAILNLRMRDLLDISALPIFKLSLLKSEKMRDLLSLYVKKKNIEDFPIPFKCVATDLLSGRLHVFDKGDAVTAMQASSTIPSVFRPVPFNDGEELLVDGGCLCRLPIKLVKEMGADVVVAIDVLKNSSSPIENVDNIIMLMLRVFEVMDANTTALMRLQDGHMCDLLLEPDMKGISSYKVKDLDRTFDEGYKLGQANVDKIKELLK